MSIYNLVEYSDNYSKKSGNSNQFCRDEPNNTITDSQSFKFKSRFLNNTNNASIIDAKIVVLLKYLSNFWRTLEILLINFEINDILAWSEGCVISEGNRLTAFAILQ